MQDSLLLGSLCHTLHLQIKEKNHMISIETRKTFNKNQHPGNSLELSGYVLGAFTAGSGLNPQLGN